MTNASTWRHIRSILILPFTVTILVPMFLLISTQSFDGSIIVYRKEHAGLGVVEHFDMDTIKITKWSVLG